MNKGNPDDMDHSYNKSNYAIEGSVSSSIFSSSDWFNTSIKNKPLQTNQAIESFNSSSYQPIPEPAHSHLNIQKHMNIGPFNSHHLSALKLESDICHINNQNPITNLGNERNHMQSVNSSVNNAISSSLIGSQPTLSSLPSILSSSSFNTPSLLGVCSMSQNQINILDYLIKKDQSRSPINRIPPVTLAGPSTILPSDFIFSSSSLLKQLQQQQQHQSATSIIDSSNNNSSFQSIPYPAHGHRQQSSYNRACAQDDHSKMVQEYTTMINALKLQSRTQPFSSSSLSNRVVTHNNYVGGKSQNADSLIGIPSINNYDIPAVVASSSAASNFIIAAPLMKSQSFLSNQEATTTKVSIDIEDGTDLSKTNSNNSGSNQEQISSKKKPREDSIDSSLGLALTDDAISDENETAVDDVLPSDEWILSSTTHKKARRVNKLLSPFKISSNHANTSSPTSSSASPMNQSITEFDSFSSSKMSHSTAVVGGGSNITPKFWTCEEDKALISAVRKLGPKNWRDISSHVAGRNPTQCQQRWSKVLAPGLRKGPWSQAEDDMLLTLAIQQIKKQQVANSSSSSAENPNETAQPSISHYRINWKPISEMIPGRTAKQCRARWVNNLNPELKKDKWTKEEDDKILSLYETLGSKWSFIASQLKGRSENAVKIRFISLNRSKHSKSPMDSSISST